MSTHKYVALAVITGIAAATHVVVRQREAVRLYLDALGLAAHKQQPLLPASIEVRCYLAVASSEAASVSPLSNREIRRLVRANFADQMLFVAEKELHDEQMAERNQRHQHNSWRELPGAS